MGDSSGIPALRKVTTKDIPNGEKRRYSDLKFLVKKLMEKLPESERFDNPSMMQINQMYDKAMDGLNISSRTIQNRQRRSGELVWTTIVRILRTSSQ